MSDNSITAALAEAVRASLPAHLSDELRFVLEDAAATKAINERLEAQNAELREQLNTLRANFRELEKITPVVETLEQRDRELTGRERMLDLTLAKADIKAAEQRTADLIRVFEIVFKAPATRTEIQRQIGHLNPNGGYITSSCDTETSTATEQ